MHEKIVPALSVLSLFGILFMVNYTTPMKAGVLGVLVFFTMIFILLFGIMVGLIKILQKILKGNKKQGGASSSKTYLYAIVMAFGPIMLLIIRTFSAISIMTVAFVIIFVVLGCFLLYKRA